MASTQWPASSELVRGGSDLLDLLAALGVVASDAALGLMPNYVYINDGISFLIIGYNFG